MNVSSRWEGSYRCRVEVRDFVLHVDEPPQYGGDDTGPQPTELLLAAVASCLTLAIAHVARKHDRPLGDLQVAVEGHYDGPRFKRIVVDVSADISRAPLQWLVDRAVGLCYVSNTLGCELEYRVA